MTVMKKVLEPNNMHNVVNNLILFIDFAMACSLIRGAKLIHCPWIRSNQNLFEKWVRHQGWSWIGFSKIQSRSIL